MKKKLLWLSPVLLILLAAAGFLIYVEIYYHAEPAADEALVSDAKVTVTKTDFGWFFDGSSEDKALVFYPGAKVEEKAYAPFLHRLAGKGVDVFLISMPFRIALFGENKAETVINEYSYEHWYIGGHSLGGSAASEFASDNEDLVDGIILCASYPMKKLDDSLFELEIYGSEDGVINAARLAENSKYDSADLTVYTIKGGNHAQFGNYGIQNGDGAAYITSDAQQDEAVGIIVDNIVKDSLTEDG